jgi:mono/diheme cytochrome c family protein
MKRVLWAVIIMLVLPAAAFAQGENKDGMTAVHSITLPNVPPDLKEGKGKELVEKYCAICHSPDYIPMQPPFSQEKWAGIVHKMVKVYGAPVPEDVAKEIIDYLGANYGPEK